MDANTLVACARRLLRIQAIYLTFKTGNEGITGLRRLYTLSLNVSGLRIAENEIQEVFSDDKTT